MSTDSLSLRLAQATSRIRFNDIPDSAIRAAELSLLDAVGVSGAAATHIDAQRFAEITLEEGGRGDAVILGFGRRVPSAAAAFANGALAHALDFEDSYDKAPLHPNAQVIPAILALAEREGLTGKDVLTAIAVGCDVTCRLGVAVGDSMAERGWYTPPILGAIGAAVGGANLLRLTPEQTVDVISLVISQATASGEVKNSPLSSIRAIRDAFASHAAVRAVELAERGIVGFDTPLDGAAGFFQVYTGAPPIEGPLLDGLGTEFAGSDVSFKPWPSCRGTHAFVEGALALRPQVELSDIAAVELGGTPFNLMLAEPRTAKAAPTGSINAKFSVLFATAAALVHGRVTLDTFEADALSDPAVLDMAQCVTYHVDEHYEAAGIAAAGSTTLVLKNGQRLTHHVPAAKGAPASPLSEDELRSKFIMLAELGENIDSSRAATIADALLSMRDVTNVRSLFDAHFAH